MKAIAALLLTLPLTLSGQSIGFKFSSATGKAIALIPAKGPAVEVEPGKHAKTKTIKMPFNSTFTAWINPLEVPVQASPSRVNFGTLRPTKGMNTILVRLEKDGDQLKAVLKIGMSGHGVTDTSNPFAPKPYPEPKKIEGDVWVLEFPEPLKPGDYALVSDSENWHFQVPAETKVAEPKTAEVKPGTPEKP